jgi:hypothetical protein
VGLNGGPQFKPNQAVSFVVHTANQEETDRYWSAIIGNGGVESALGWCKDRWGYSWQITPCVLLAAMSSPDRVATKRVMEAMLTMRKIDIAAIETALRASCEAVHARGAMVPRPHQFDHHPCRPAATDGSKRTNCFYCG